MKIAVTVGGRPAGEYDVDGPVLLGRQDPQTGEGFPCCRRLDEESAERIVVAPYDERGVSRRHARLEPRPDGTFDLENQSDVELTLNGTPVPKGPFAGVPLPALLRFGTRVVVRIDPDDGGEIAGLAQQSIAPFSAGRTVGRYPTEARRGDVEAVLRWLGSSIDVFQSAATSDAFFDRAAQALVDAVGLDCGRVLLREGDCWRTQAVRCASDEFAVRPPSTRVLRQVAAERDTFWQTPGPAAAKESLREVEAVIAAPILDRGGEVIGALYGDRRRRPGRPAAEEISKIDASLVRLLASAVAAGLARLREEEQALAARGRFEQFFTPELSRHLAEHPDLVERSRDAEVTVLFGDVRGFSRISERIGPARTAEWMSAIMDALSAPVRDEDGVLVDYVGDEIVAMWGAPADQSDHADRACRAALRMLAAVPDLDARWREEIGGPTSVGIGINTGPARVGNTGSKFKFKYGPLGNTVNLASRVQGATKYLRTPCLITESTRRALRSDLPARRLCRVRVVNIADAVTLYELPAAPDDRWAALRDRYEAALDHFSARRFAAAAEALGRLASEEPDDGPSRLLLRRAADWMLDADRPFDDVWELPGK